MTVQVDRPNEAADYDVQLFKGVKAEGDPIASAESSADPEQLFVPPTCGDYVVRIVPFLPLPSWS